jgi:hypothetical protein
MNFKSALMISAIAASFSAMPVMANDKAPGSGPNPFSDCGIGAALFPNTDWAAVTSNIIWDIGTTAVTSATASPETCNGKNMETALFINRTYDELIVETAQGEGHNVTAMLDLMQCPSAGREEVVASIRGGVKGIVSSVSYSSMSHLEKASAYYDVMASATAESC